MDFTIDGNPVWFHGITGTVKGLRNWSSSDVSSSGGGGFVTKEGGYIASPKITTTVNQHQKFWIATTDGHEKEISNPNLHCRDGHNVSLIWGADKDRKDGSYLIFKNHSTQEVYLFPGGAYSFKSIAKITAYQILISVAFFIDVVVLIILSNEYNINFDSVSRFFIRFSCFGSLILLIALIVSFFINRTNFRSRNKIYSSFAESLLQNK
ncbi:MULTISPECIES: hypothetical protein [Acetobacter]|uniref:hypothetical protein n=1 Tax=Acetobacter TaxID=434 RepID=UPI00376F74CF